MIDKLATILKPYINTKLDKNIKKICGEIKETLKEEFEVLNLMTLTLIDTKSTRVTLYIDYIEEDIIDFQIDYKKTYKYSKDKI